MSKSRECESPVFPAAVGGLRVRNFEFPSDPADSPPPGEGEEADPESTDSHKKYKKTGGSKVEPPREVVKTEGAHAFLSHDTDHNDDGITKETIAKYGVFKIAKKCTTKDSDIVPHLENPAAFPT